MIFEPNETEKIITLSVVADNILEPTESFSVNLVDYSPSALASTSSIIGTIQNDDSSVLSISSPASAEGVPLVFRFSLTNPVQGGFRLPYSTVADTAQLTDDFTGTSGDLNFAGLAGESLSVIVRTSSDSTVERDETMKLLTGAIQRLDPSIRSLLQIPQQSIGTILNDDMTRISVRSVQVTEGDSGTATAEFEIKLGPNPVDTALFVTAATDSNGQTATAGTDYQSTQQILGFSGEADQSLTIHVPINGDLLNEADELFNLALANLVAAGRENGIVLVNGTGTIVNDDSPRIVVSRAFSAEGDSDNRNMTFSVTLIKPLPGPQSVTVTTANGTASEGSDFIAKSQTLSFAGLDGESQTFTVTINSDSTTELDESFAVNLSNLTLSSGASPTAYSLFNSTGTILNDDKAVLSITVLPGVDEGKPAEFRVRLTGAVDVPITVSLRTLSESAVADKNYTVTQSNVSLLGHDGEVVMVNVATTQNVVPLEPDVTFGMELWNVVASGRNVGLAPYAMTTIHDDDQLHVQPGDAKPKACKPREVRNLMTGADPNPSYGTSWSDAPLPRAVPVLVGFTGDPNTVVINDQGEMFDSTGRSYGTGWYRDQTGLIYHNIVGPSGITPAIGQANVDNLPHTVGSGGAGPSDPLPPPKTSCDPPDDPEPEELPPQEVPESIHADWVVSINQPLTFNPFAGFNYTRTDDVVLSISVGDKIAKVGETIPLSFGSVKVNADNTLTYTPDPSAATKWQAGHLIAERDANGNPVRYTGEDSFSAHYFNKSALAAMATDNRGVQSGKPDPMASTPVNLMISNQLPVLLGQRIHDESLTASRLDSSIYAEYETTYLVDMRKLYTDPDGNAEVKVSDVEYGTKKLSTEQNNTLSIPIGAVMGISTITGLPFMIEERSLTVTLLGDHTLAVTNPITMQDVQDSELWSYSGYPSDLQFSVVLTDGQQVPGKDANGQAVAKTHTWKFTLPVRPNHVYDTDSLWRNRLGVPDMETRPWLTAIRGTSANTDLVNKFDVSTFTSDKMAYASRENVRGVDVDMFNGTFTKFQSLILDASGGSSELSLPGLIYDSSTVFNDGSAAGSSKAKPSVYFKVSGPAGATLQSAKFYWDNDAPLDVTFTQNPAGTFWAVAQPALVTRSGMHSWRFTADVGAGGSTAKIEKYGESVVVLNDNEDAFGAGWQLADVPQFIFDDRGNDESTDDRLIIAFPGTEPKIFDASSLTLYGNFDYSGLLNSVAAGSMTYSTDGYADRLEFGKLESSAAGLVYTAPDGTQYHAKHYHTTDSARIANTGKDYYLIDRIEQPGVDFSPADTSSDKRRGVAFEWNTTDPAVKHSMLTRIVASDRSATVFEYTAGYLASTKLFSSVDANGASVGSTVHQVTYTVIDGLLRQISDPNIGGTPYTRKFSYSGETLKVDQTFNGTQPSALVLVAQSTIDIDPFSRVDRVHSGAETSLAGSYLTSSVKLGSAFEIDPNLPGQMIASITDDLGNVTNLVESAEVATGGSYETLIGIDVKGHSVSRRQRYTNGTHQTSLGEVKWTYDVAGLVQSEAERVSETGTGAGSFRYNRIWHDYEKPTVPAGLVASLNGRESVYEPSDYRGNAILQVGSSGVTKFQYETRDTERFALGMLVATESDATVDGAGHGIEDDLGQTVKTVFENSRDGRVLTVRTIRGADDSVLGAMPTDRVLLATERDTTSKWVYCVTNTNACDLEQFQEPSGLVTSYTQYDHGRLRESTQLDSISGLTTRTTFTYDPRGFADVITTFNGAGDVTSQVDYDYDALGNLKLAVTKARDKDSNLVVVDSKSFSYDAAGRVVETVGADNQRTKSEYMTSGLLRQKIVGADATYFNSATNVDENISETFTYEYFTNGFARKTTVSDENGVRFASAFHYDPEHRTTFETIDSIAGLSVINQDGTVTIRKDAKETSFTTLDMLGRTVLTGNLLTNARSSFAYTDIRVDQPTEVITLVSRGENDKVSQVTNYRYDNNGNVLRSQSGTLAPVVHLSRADGTTAKDIVLAEWGRIGKEWYGPDGKLVRSINENQNRFEGTTATKTDFQYDSSGQLLRSETPLAEPDQADSPKPLISKTVRSQDGKLIREESTAANGPVTISWMNDLGQVLITQDAFGAKTYNTYDGSGRLRTVTVQPQESSDEVPASETVFTYDARDRLRKTEYFAGGRTASSQAVAQISYEDYMLSNSPWSFISTAPNGDKTAMITDSQGTTIATVGPPGASNDSIYNSSITVNGYSYGADVTVHAYSSLAKAVGPSTAPSTKPNYMTTPDSPVAPQVETIIGIQGQTLRSSKADGGKLSPDFNTTQTFDVNGRLMESTSGTSKTRYAYDDMDSGTGQIAVYTGATGIRTYKAYDSDGNQIAVSDNSDFRGTETVFWTYDKLDRVVSETVTLTTMYGNHGSQIASRTWEYFSDGVKYTNRNGQVLRTRTSSDGRTVTQIESQPSGTETYEDTLTLYSNGQVATAVSWKLHNQDVLRVNSKSLFKYDRFGSVASEETMYGTQNRFTVQNAFVNNHSTDGAADTNRSISITADATTRNVLTTESHYDKFGRATSVIDTSVSGSLLTSKAAKIDYDGGNVVSVKSYDTNSTTGVPLMTSSYIYNENGRLSNVTSQATNPNWLLPDQTITYTSSGQLKKVFTNLPNKPTEEADFADDSPSNHPVLKAVDFENREYDSTDRFIAQDGNLGRVLFDGNDRYDYDVEGNVSTHWAMQGEDVITMVPSTPFSYAAPQDYSTQMRSQVAGWYRVRLTPLTFTGYDYTAIPADSLTKVEVRIRLVSENTTWLLSNRRLLDITRVYDVANLGPFNFSTFESDAWNVFLDSNQKVKLEIQITVLEGNHTQRYELSGSLSLERYANANVIEYDTKGRAREIVTYLANTTPGAAPGIGAFVRKMEYNYDALGRKYERIHTEQGNTDSDFYVYDGDHIVLDLSEIGTVKQERFYVGALFMGTEDLRKIDSLDVIEMVWMSAGYDGTALSLNSTNRSMLVDYDQFGARSSETVYTDHLNGIVPIGYMGMEVELWSGLYWAGQSLYNARGGSYFVAQSLQNGAEAIYAFSGNLPGDRARTRMRERPGDGVGVSSTTSFDGESRDSWIWWAVKKIPLVPLPLGPFSITVGTFFEPSEISTVFNNSVNNGMSVSAALYNSLGTAILSEIGVRQISDALAGVDAVDGHKQSTFENYADGILGTASLVGTVFQVGALARFGGLGKIGGAVGTFDVSAGLGRMTSSIGARAQAFGKATLGAADNLASSATPNFYRGGQSLAGKSSQVVSELKSRLSAASRSNTALNDIENLKPYPVVTGNTSGCFIAGTPVQVVATGNAARELVFARHADEPLIDLPFSLDAHNEADDCVSVAIEQVELGSRINTRNPDRDQTDPPADWTTGPMVVVRLRGKRLDQSQFEAELLRPASQFYDKSVGDVLPLVSEELQVRAYAVIDSIEPAPNVEPGEGNLVVSRFRTLRVESTVTIRIGLTRLTGTSVHPIWIVNRQEFIPMGEVTAGDFVDTIDGMQVIDEVTVDNTPCSVYNLEVLCEHVYRAGDAGILVHNTTPDYLYQISAPVNAPFADRLASVASRTPAEIAARAERAAMLRRVHADSSGALHRTADSRAAYQFQGTVAQRYRKQLVRYDEKTFHPGGGQLGEIDIELRSVMLEIATSTKGAPSKFNQLRAYSSLIQNPQQKFVGLFSKHRVPVDTAYQYQTQYPLVSVIDDSNWAMLDAFVYHGARH